MAEDNRKPEDSNPRRDRQGGDDEREPQAEREREKSEHGGAEGRDHAPSDRGRPSDAPWLGGG